LGTVNQNLPGFVVLCPGLPVVGHQLWSSTFLPAVYQGTYINTEEKDTARLIQHIGLIIFSRQAIRQVFIAKLITKVTISSQQMPGGIGRGGYILQVIRRIVPAPAYINMGAIGHGAIQCIPVVRMATVF